MKAYVAELIGTFALVFCGTGAIIIDQQFGGAVTHAGVAITFGLIVTSMIYSLGPISGAHLNPAVSIAFTIARRFPAKLLPGYIISQLTGALLASFVLKFLFPLNELLGATIPMGTEMQSFILELILSFFLMLVIINVSVGSKEQGMFAGTAIGAVVGLEAMFAGPVCGASMNPARSIAPAIVSGHLEHLWVYIIAPITGALLAVPVCNYLTIKIKTT
ncbi:aquaporin [Mucilaginibacter sp. OK098]|uniref:aquaporin n=1 Tax=Mucilaginibacter sp. OK098 TaxID=1855297 RepID=UPI000911336C|nr:aquaporin [Mucilaginibacter sp. OK098]SHM50239.1 aquaporin Z [Mucilaginibacter sp. OK098]